MADLVSAIHVFLPPTERRGAGHDPRLNFQMASGTNVLDASKRIQIHT